MNQSQMRHLAFLLLCTLTASAQTAKPEELSSIVGRVLNSVTGEPVGKVSLYLNLNNATGDDSRSYATASDSAGRFDIRNIAPGKYRLTARRNGFISLDYGARAFRGAGTVLDLERPQQLKDVSFRLTPQGVIVGRILDIDGESLAGAQVQLLRSQYASNGKKVLAMVNSAYTNDLGEYRLSGLTPGRYYIYFANFEGLPPTSLATEAYMPVYYPSSAGAGGAAPFDVTAGAQVNTGDMILRKARTATVKGRVVIELAGASGIPTVRFTAQVEHNNPGSTTRSYVAKVSTSGEFELRGVTPGSYFAQAFLSKDGLGHYGHTTLQVAGADIERITITIDNGVSMSGRIRVDGETVQDLRNLVITLQPSPATMQNVPYCRVAQDLTCKIDNLDPNRYEILIEGLPDGFYTKRVRVGGSDVTYSGVDLTYGPAGQVDVLVSPKAGLVSGGVQNTETNQPAAGATVVLVPRDKERLQLPALYQQATTDQYGRFNFKNVVPGVYKVFAWEDVESSAWLDPDFIKPLESKGESVTVGESAQATVQVNLILSDSEKAKPK